MYEIKNLSTPVQNVKTSFIVLISIQLVNKNIFNLVLYFECRNYIHINKLSSAVCIKTLSLLFNGYSSYLRMDSFLFLFRSSASL